MAERPAKAAIQNPAPLPPPPTPPPRAATGSEFKGHGVQHTNNEVELEFQPRSIHPVPKSVLLAEPVELEFNPRSIKPVPKSVLLAKLPGCPQQLPMCSMDEIKEWTARLAVLLSFETPLQQARKQARETKVEL